MKNAAKKLFDAEDNEVFDRNRDICMILGDFNQNAAAWSAT